MAVIKVGDVATRETAESGGKSIAGNDTFTIVVKGEYESMLPLLPIKGDPWAGYEGFFVDSAKLEKGPGGSGICRIELVENQAAEYTFENTELSDLWEIDWRPHEKPLLSNPKYKTLETYGDVTEEFIDIELWRNEPDAALRKAFQYQNGMDTSEPPAPVIVTLSASMQAVAKLILKGVESYIVPAPVITRTRTYRRRKTFGGIGFLEVPQVAPPGYTFLKTGDNWKQNDGEKTWTRREEWTGGDSIEESLYVEGTST
jgi:hypothetical protein